MERKRAFRFLTFTTYLPLPLLGIMIIFGVLGKLMHVGWLESAPGVLLIPTLLTYYVSITWGAIYGYLKREDMVYLMAFISIALWIVGLGLNKILTFSREVMIGLNVFILAALLALHILQYSATKKWEARVRPARK